MHNWTYPYSFSGKENEKETHILQCNWGLAMWEKELDGMIDREKVIKGLEYCTFILGKRKCNECPYQKDNGCYQLQDDFHVLLKEQDAVPVIQREIAHMLFWCCGSCGVAITDGDKFCRNCGRELKWE